jgi:tRNA 2-thiouridine synthesizing protein E
MGVGAAASGGFPMVTDATGDAVATDEEGYLVEPAAWDEATAQQLAGQERVTLSEEHWQVLGFMRRFYDEHRIAPDARFVIRFLAGELGYGRKAQNHLFQLFPYGYVQQACKIAGMKRPRAWSTG